MAQNVYEGTYQSHYKTVKKNLIKDVVRLQITNPQRPKKLTASKIKYERFGPTILICH